MHLTQTREFGIGELSRSYGPLPLTQHVSVIPIGKAVHQESQTDACRSQSCWLIFCRLFMLLLMCRVQSWTKYFTLLFQKCRIDQSNYLCCRCHFFLYVMKSYATMTISGTFFVFPNSSQFLFSRDNSLLAISWSLAEWFNISTCKQKFTFNAPYTEIVFTFLGSFSLSSENVMPWSDLSTQIHLLTCRHMNLSGPIQYCFTGHRHLPWVRQNLPYIFSSYAINFSFPAPSILTS